MATHYVYYKKRAEFGRPYKFVEKPASLDVNIPSNRSWQRRFIRILYNDKATQKTPIWSSHTLLTDCKTFENRGILHIEGGYPASIDVRDNESTSRYKKKQEKEANYPGAVIGLSKHLERLIEQNNSIDIFERYFSWEEEEVEEKKDNASNINQINYCRDPDPVTHICWSPGVEAPYKIAVTYGHHKYQYYPPNYTRNAFIWDMVDVTNPLLTLQPPSLLTTIEYCPKDETMVVGGCLNGQLCIWDTRRGSQPVEMCGLANRHMLPCTCLMFWSSKTVSEIFSGSEDGRILWWDVRKFRDPVEELILDRRRGPGKRNLLNAYGARVLEYDPLLPTKFSVGTDDGCILTCNRKAAGDKVSNVFKRHSGPVLNVQRNPSYNKNILSAGDYVARVSNDDARESHIFSTPHNMVYVTHCSWSLTVPYIFFLTKADGNIETWDLLVSQKTPVSITKLTNSSLDYIRLHDSGSLAAVGSNNGSIFFLKLSPYLSVPEKHNRNIIAAWYERETRREKIVEGKIKEMIVRKMKMQQEKAATEEEGEQEDIEKVETLFKATIQKQSNDMKEKMKRFDIALMEMRAEQAMKREAIESLARGDEFRELEKKEQERKERERKEQEALQKMKREREERLEEEESEVASDEQDENSKEESVGAEESKVE